MYYERFLKCSNCDHTMRLTTLWRPNRTGLQIENAWLEQFKTEHSEAKHPLDLVITSWRKGIYIKK